jgi:hypothetical protein
MSGIGLAASFTCSKILTEAFDFWLDQVAIDEPLRVAGTSHLALRFQTSHLALRFELDSHAHASQLTVCCTHTMQATTRFSRSCLLL